MITLACLAASDNESARTLIHDTGRMLACECAMPMYFYIYPDFRLLFIRGHGMVTQTERIETMLMWLSDPAYELCTSALLDVADAQSTPRLAELRQTIALLQQRLPPGGPRRLAIVTSKPITFAVARVFEQLMRLKGYRSRSGAFRIENERGPGSGLTIRRQIPVSDLPNQTRRSLLLNAVVMEASRVD